MDLIIGVYSSWENYEDLSDHYKPKAKHLQMFEQQLQEVRGV